MEESNIEQENGPQETNVKMARIEETAKGMSTYDASAGKGRKGKPTKRNETKRKKQ